MAARIANKSANYTPATAGFLLSVRAAGRTAKTERTYRQALEALHRFTADSGMPQLGALTAEHLREFFLFLYERGCKPGGVSVRYRALQQYYKWLVAEGERPDNPLSRIPPPRIAEQVMPHYTPEDVKAVLAAARSPKTMMSLRDRAIILTLYDTGVRGQELCGLTTASADLRGLTLKVDAGKGGHQRLIGIGYRTAQAIERYLRHRPADSRWLFISERGNRLTFDCVRLMLERRFRQAGIEFKGLHAFRRGFAIAYLDSGGEPMDLRTLCGWSSEQMLRRYTKATETERALRGHRTHSPGDKL